MPARLLLATSLSMALATSVLAAGASKPASSAPAPKPTPAVDCKPIDPSFFRDEAMTMKVASKLQFNKALLREKVNVKVTGGVAMLWGGMSSQEAIATAVKAASEVSGIHCVNNQLKVGPPEVDERSHTGNGG